jgi:hypothetical protein
MSKKHFRQLAERFHSIKPEPAKSSDHEQTGQYAARLDTWNLSVGIVADACQSANERFDRGRFLYACENGL